MFSKGLTSTEAFARLRHLLSHQRRQLRVSLITPPKFTKRIAALLWFGRALLCLTFFCIGLTVNGAQMKTPTNIVTPFAIMLLATFSSILVFGSRSYLQGFASSWRTSLVDELESCAAIKTPVSAVPYCLQTDTQLVIRDGRLVLIPILLLVSGDVALLRHGQHIQFRCHVQHLSGVTEEINPGSVFSVDLKSNPSGSIPVSRQDHFKRLTEAVVTEAPISELLSYSEEHNHSTEVQPAFTLFVSLLTSLIDAVWICLGIILLAALSVHTYKSFGTLDKLAVSWMSLVIGKFIFYSSAFTFWLLWRIAVMFTFIRFHTVEFRLTRDFSAVDSASGRSFDSQTEGAVANLQQKLDSRLRMNIPQWIDRVKRTYFELKKLNLFELDNTVLTLGSVNSVCCVQQDGILSRNSLTPEKVFFFHKQHHHHHHAHLDQKGLDSTCPTETAILDQDNQTELCANIPGDCLNATPKTNGFLMSPTDSRRGRIGSVCSDLDEQNLDPGDRKRPIVPVILNLRTDSYWPYLLHFEKPKWAHYLASMKPIGLSLLLNNAHTLPIPRLAFTDHIASLRSRSNVAVQCHVDPLLSCQCSVARSMGFTKGAVRGFTCCGSLGAYAIDSTGASNQHLQSSNEDRSVNLVLQERALRKELTVGFAGSRNPCTMEYSFSAVFTHPTAQGEYQLMTQATGDMLVTLCSDVWDGRGISPLSEAERDALLDFYHRNASAAYCVGFAYTPLLSRLPCMMSDNDGTFDASGEDPIIIELPKYKPTDWIEETHSNQDTRCHNDLFVMSRPASARLPNTTPLYDDPLPGHQFAHQPIQINSRRYRSGLVAPHMGSPMWETKSPFFGRLAIVTDSTGTGEQLTNPVITSFSTKSRHPEPSRWNNGTKRFVGLTRSCSSDFIPTHRLKPLKACHSFAPDHLNQAVDNKTKSTQTPAEGELLKLLENQIFLGLISMQQQVRPDVVEAIKQLEEACIRFVYFSRENELRSRVFAERLGLEYGWNCHISLANPSERCRPNPDHPAVSSDPSHTCRDYLENHPVVHSPVRRSRKSGLSSAGQLKSFRPLCRFDSVPILSKQQASHSPEGNFSLEVTGNPNSAPLHNRRIFHRRCSLPILAVKMQPEQFGSGTSLPDSMATLVLQANSLSSSSPPSSASPSSSPTSSSSASSVHPDQEKHSEGYCGRRLSYYVTQNKSRLPCGIDHIRPHLQNVDNVPLQVSLFTDCSTASIRELIRIRQEYGEIVCVVGSAYSVDSLRLMQCADVAVAIQPEIPKPCDAFAAGYVDNITKFPRGLGIKCMQRTVHSDEMRSENVPLNLSAGAAQATSVVDFIRCLDLTARLVCSMSPQILNLSQPGFYVYDLIREAHISLNNLFFCLAFYWLAPIPFILVQLLLLMMGLPTMPFRVWTAVKLNNSSSAFSTTTLWLPPRWVRTRLIPFSNGFLFQRPNIHGNLSVSVNWHCNALPHTLSNVASLFPEFGSGQWLWLILFVIPLLSLSMLDRRVERTRPLREPPVKRGKWLTKRKLFRVGLITTARLLPSTLICVLSAVGLLWWAPGFEHCAGSDVLRNCTVPNQTIQFTEANLSRVISDSGALSCSGQDNIEMYQACFVRFAVLVRLVKDFVFSQLVYYLVLISLTYANFGQAIQKLRWSTNPSWCISVAFVVLIQTSWFLLRGLRLNGSPGNRPIYVLHPGIVAAGGIWCFILIILNEVISWKERRLILAEHRLARLYFGTKLGMYSPV